MHRSSLTICLALLGTGCALFRGQVVTPGDVITQEHIEALSRRLVEQALTALDEILRVTPEDELRFVMLPGKSWLTNSTAGLDAVEAAVESRFTAHPRVQMTSRDYVRQGLAGAGVTWGDPSVYLRPDVRAAFRAFMTHLRNPPNHVAWIALHHQQDDLIASLHVMEIDDGLEQRVPSATVRVPRLRETQR